MSFLAELSWRGLLHQTAGDDIEAHLSSPRIGYAGFDPTSDSLTIGNYMPMKLLAHWQRLGHTPIVVMGGGTGLIGDPSGKTAERQLLSRERVQANIEAQRPIFERVLDFSPKLSNRAIVVDNAEWLARVGYLEMLRDVGKHFSVNTMIQRDSVASRLHSREQGISYTEFSYVLLQAYDFLHLFRERGCTVQMGGSDQFGNMLSGMDLVRRVAGAETFAVTTPLLLNRDGTKVGKSEKGAVYLTPRGTSAYAFHQYWLNVADDELLRYLQWFTFLDRGAVEEIVARHAAAPQERIGQRALAAHMTDLFHGPTERARAEQAAGALFSGDVRGLDEATLREVFAEVPRSTHARSGLDGEGVALVELLPTTTLCASKREAREFLANGAVTVNGERVDADRRVAAGDLLHGHTILLRRGKKAWHATMWQ
ncbi:MAG: tyrosine--tRNA ligase [Phycisphaerales bacterium]|jgi:tyrosyl-tRNA synthetase